MANPDGVPKLNIKTKCLPLNYKTLEQEKCCLRIFKIPDLEDISIESIVMKTIDVVEQLEETDLALFEGKIMHDRSNFSILGYKNLEVRKAIQKIFSEEIINLSPEKLKQWSARSPNLTLFPDTIGFDVVSPQPPSYDECFNIDD